MDLDATNGPTASAGSIGTSIRNEEGEEAKVEERYEATRIEVTVKIDVGKPPPSPRKIDVGKPSPSRPRPTP